MTCYEFYWAPEGRLIRSYIAKSLRAAKAAFRRDYKASYARFMGEVYIQKVKE